LDIRSRLGDEALEVRVRRRDRIEEALGVRHQEAVKEAAPNAAA
jgi:hypothetical protein